MAGPAVARNPACGICPLLGICAAQAQGIAAELPRKLVNQRLLFMGAALGGILAGRESELADRTRPHPMWSSDATLHEISRSLAAMVERPGPSDGA
jgi:adenine-specific DNA glycosylase